jgi:HK97 family phage prohead protease
MGDDETRETLGQGELVYRASDPEAMSFRDDGDAAVLEGRMMPYDEWTEVNSAIEGHFMERFAPGALAKSMTERAGRIRALFEHGLDAVLGRQTIATIEGLRDEPDGAYYRATLLNGLPPLLVSGLRANLYGSSIRFAPLKWDRVRSPKASEHNPNRLPEHTIREAYIKEFSVVTFPQYEGATASIRSITDELAARQLAGNPARLLEILEELKDRHEPPNDVGDNDQDEPDHSEPPAQADPAVGKGSRSTQPSRDYLQPKKEEPSWRL